MSDSPVALVVGTRPEIIKMSPVVRECQRRGIPFYLIHTGQHYSYNMDKVFFEQLELPAAKYNLEVGSGPHGGQTAKMLTGIEGILEDERPSWVLVQGDTNTVVAGAMAASKMGIKVGHVEAGLRSHDRSMPEEINRIIADHVADMNFAPTEAAAKNLRREGLPADRIQITGNTIVDAVTGNRELAAKKSRALTELALTTKGYVLLTAHRQENVDDRVRFQGIMDGANDVGRTLGLPVIYPIHPRARKMLGTLGVRTESARLIEPQDFLGFLQLESNARLVLTDSGGVQEETCILGVPCVTLRDNTERPETIEVGANRLAGTKSSTITEAAEAMLKVAPGWANPFGDGRAAERIVDAVEA